MESVQNFIDNNYDGEDEIFNSNLSSDLDSISSEETEEDYETAEELDVEFTNGKLFVIDGTVEKKFYMDYETLEGGYDIIDVLHGLLVLSQIAPTTYFKFSFVFQYLKMEHPLTLTIDHHKIASLFKNVFHIDDLNDLLDVRTFNIIEDRDEDNEEYQAILLDKELMRRYEITSNAVDMFRKEYYQEVWERIDSGTGFFTQREVQDMPKFSQVYYEAMVINLQGGAEYFKIINIQNKLYEIYFPKSTNRCLLLVLKDYSNNFTSLYKNAERKINLKAFHLINYLDQIDIMKKALDIKQEIVLHSTEPLKIDDSKINLIHKGRHVGIIRDFELRKHEMLQKETRVGDYADIKNTILVTIDYEWVWNIFERFTNMTLEQIQNEAYEHDTTLKYAIAKPPSLGVVHLWDPTLNNRKEFIISSVRESLDILFSIKRTTKKDIFVYSHNGSLVENILLLEEIRKIHANDPKFMLEIGNNSGNKIKSFKYQGITFIDSVLYLKSSLNKAMMAYTPGKTKYHHPELICESCKINPLEDGAKCISCSRLYFNKKSWSAANKEDLKYIQMDGSGLMDVLIKFNELVCIRLGLKDKWCLSKLSLASIAKTRLYQIYPMIDTTYFQSIIRPFYKGGDCQIHFQGTVKSIEAKTEDDKPNTLYYPKGGAIVSFDYVSMYPFIQSRPLPVRPRFISELTDNSSWCACVLLSQHDDPSCMCNRYPIIDYYCRKNDKIINPIFITPTLVEIWSFQYQQFKSCYNIEKIYYVVEFDTEPIYTDYVLPNFARRAEVGPKSTEGMNIKLMMNAGTGTLGLKSERTTKVMSHKKCEKYIRLKESLHRTITQEVGNFEWLQYTEQKNVKTQLLIISYITAKGRFMINMRKHMEFLQGNIPLQTDTDGLETLYINRDNIPINEPEVLGSQKIELYSQLTIRGCKDYSFIRENETIEKAKCKGMSHSIETWGRDCKTAEINIKIVPKHFSGIYNKGLIDDRGVVSPYKI